MKYITANKTIDPVQVLSGQNTYRLQIVTKPTKGK